MHNNRLYVYVWIQCVCVVYQQKWSSSHSAERLLPVSLLLQCECCVCVCVCNIVLPSVVCVSLYPCLSGMVCVFSCASSLELKNAPNANLSRNGTNRNKNAKIFNPHYLSSLYFSFHRWMAAASFICSVKVLPGGRDERREEWGKGTQWAGDSQKKRDAGDVQLSFPFFSCTQLFINLVEALYNISSIHPSKSSSSFVFPFSHLVFTSLTHIQQRKKVPEKNKLLPL